MTNPSLSAKISTFYLSPALEGNVAYGNRTETVDSPSGGPRGLPAPRAAGKNLMWNWVRVRYRDARDGVAVVARREYTIDK